MNIIRSFFKKKREKGYLSLKGINNKIYQINNNDDKSSVKRKIKNIIIEIQGDNNEIIIGCNLNVAKGILHIKVDGNNNKIVIGKNMFIQRGNVKFIVFKGAPFRESNNCNLTIGDNCIFSGNSQFLLGEADTKINIGKNCGISKNVFMSTSDSHLIYDCDTGKRLNEPGDIIIGDHCWINFDVTVFNHSRVKSETIIGAKSLVNKKFDKGNVILAGIPAKIVRENVGWDLLIDKDDLNKNNEDNLNFKANDYLNTVYNQK